MLDAARDQTTGAEAHDGPSIAELAAAALEACDGDVQAAARKLEADARADMTNWRVLTDHLLGQASWDAIRRAVRVTRSKVWTAPAPTTTPESQAERVTALAAGNLLMFPLPGGKRLGEATRDEVQAAAHFYEQQADDMAHKARWLQAIAAKVKNAKKKVAEVLDDAKLRELRDAAKPE